MEFLIGLIIFLAVIYTCFLLPWINNARLKDLEYRFERLKNSNQAYAAVPHQEKQPERTRATLEAEKQELLAELNSEELQDNIEGVPETPEIIEEPEHEDPIEIDHVPPAYKEEIYFKQKPKVSLEQQFGARLPVWIGGIALALSGFFLVKYSIDNNLLSPFVRVTLGGILGASLLFSAYWIRTKENISNGVRIAQSLSGSGIATLYVSVFAATSLYQLLPMLAGLLLMTAITGIAVAQSLRHGAPIAMLGLMGGFLTPALLSYDSHIPTPILFIYLYIIFAGLMAVIKQRKWWGLSIPTLLGAFIWVMQWMFTSFSPDDTIWIGLFLVAVSSTIVFVSRQEYGETETAKTPFVHQSQLLNYLGLGGALILMGLVTVKAQFGYLEWSLFGILALGSMVLAYFKDRLYGFLPWVSMAVNAVMLFAWRPDIYLYSYADWASISAGFAILYVGFGSYLIWRSSNPFRWAYLISATSLGYYLLSYYKLLGSEFLSSVPFFWGGLALVLSAYAIHMTRQARLTLDPDNPVREHILAIFAITATAFVSLALTIELEREFLSVAFAAQVLAMSWIATKVDIKALRPITMVLALIFGFLLIPQILLLIQLTVYSLVEAKLYLQQTVPIVHWPLFQLGLPASLFLGSAYFLRQNKDGKLVRALEIASVMLIGVMGYYLNRHAFHIDADILFVKAGFFERNVMTNILFIYGLGCFFVGRYFKRKAFSWSAMGLCAVALFRIIYFDLLLHNPLWDSQIVRGTYIANELLLAFGLPIIWSSLLGKELQSLGKTNLVKFSGASILLFIFALITMNVRHFFHGADLSIGITSNAEIYAYSAVWLLLGVGLLVAGIIKDEKVIRYASLLIMTLSVFKVFLYDASELEGLYRVFSFLGLGICLIGLSHIYTRFVSKTEYEK